MKLFYVGLIGNCDDSIFQVELGNEYIIDSISSEDAIRLLMRLRDSSLRDASMTLMLRGVSRGSNTPTYSVRKEIEISDEKNINVAEMCLLKEGAF